MLEPTLFTPEDTGHILNHLLDPTITPSVASGLLVGMAAHKIDMAPEHIAAAAKAVRRHALLVSFPEAQASLQDTIVDIVGTGGDGHDTFNVSTTAAIVAAGAGCKVAKHGNRASSSASGSADLIMSLDIPLPALQPHHFPTHLSTGHFTFLYAQTHHPSMRNVASIRRELGIPTIFNVLGPLLNPARPRRMVVGVRAPLLGPVIARALQLSGVEHGLVVCGEECLDELSPAGRSFIWEFYTCDGPIHPRTVHPTEDFGLPTHPLLDVRGKGPEENSKTLRDILEGRTPDNDPVLDFILLNTAPLLVLSGIASSYLEGVQLARESIRSGAALRELEAFRAMAHEVSKDPSLSSPTAL